jgi:hypothetical protein
VDQGGVGHYGDDIAVISLSLKEPVKIDEYVHGSPMWSTVDLTVYIQKSHGAMFPVVCIAVGEGGEADLLKLTMEEARDFGAALTQAWEDALTTYHTK